MLDLSRDTQLLTEFKKSTSNFVHYIKEIGEPTVLTINGKAELLAQDPPPTGRLRGSRPNEASNFALMYRIEITDEARDDADATYEWVGKHTSASYAEKWSQKQMPRGSALAVVRLRVATGTIEFLRGSAWRPF